MTQHQIDFNTLRAELRALPRGGLLLIAERAIELLPPPVRPPRDHRRHITARRDTLVSRRRHEREYYEHVEINSKGRQEQSGATDAFVAEFDDTRSLDWGEAYSGYPPLLDCRVAPSARNPDGMGVIQDDSPMFMREAPRMTQCAAKRGAGCTVVRIYAVN